MHPQDLEDMEESDIFVPDKTEENGCAYLFLLSKYNGRKGVSEALDIGQANTGCFTKYTAGKTKRKGIVERFRRITLQWDEENSGYINLFLGIKQQNIKVWVTLIQ